ncbi:MAG: cold-shock protein [SAR324 cluster bacterium]|uniref:Cold-shock protein n=1 Tax=SAR324 cluster bacterium TaxID=2024889 RepID=A0A2A4T2Y6_9DELT|nr:MAG: cold-shock protein [SAR324 cluster bacterium]
MGFLKNLFASLTGRGSKACSGTVKWFSRQKRFGFIEQDGGGDIFVHLSQIRDSGLKGLFQGDRVEFEISENEKGPFACKIKKL